MCCNKSLNNKTNRLHKRHHRIVYNYKKSNFNELLVKDSSLSLYHENLRKLAVEMFKVSRGLSPKIANKLFQFRQRFSFKSLWVIQFSVVHQTLNSFG